MSDIKVTFTFSANFSLTEKPLFTILLVDNSGSIFMAIESLKCFLGVTGQNHY